MALRARSDRALRIAAMLGLQALPVHDADEILEADLARLLQQTLGHILQHRVGGAVDEGSIACLLGQLDGRVEHRHGGQAQRYRGEPRTTRATEGVADDSRTEAIARRSGQGELSPGMNATDQLYGLGAEDEQ